MKKIGIITFLFVSLTGITWGETIVQSFDTGAITPGSDTINTFTVNKFNSSYGTLTKVTFEISVISWGGSYEVENTTDPSVAVTGSMQQGISSRISGDLVPNGIASSAAIQTAAFTLSKNGDNYSITGALEGTPISSTLSTKDVVEGMLSSYIGTDTYDVDFHSSQNNTHTADGATTFTGTSASSQGFLTVTYEYTTVPEPGSLALLAIGCAVLGLRRRQGLSQ